MGDLAIESILPLYRHVEGIQLQFLYSLVQWIEKLTVLQDEFGVCGFRPCVDLPLNLTSEPSALWLAHPSTAWSFQEKVVNIVLSSTSTQDNPWGIISWLQRLCHQGAPLEIILHVCPFLENLLTQSVASDSILVEEILAFQVFSLLHLFVRSIAHSYPSVCLDEDTCMEIVLRLVDLAFRFATSFFISNDHHQGCLSNVVKELQKIVFSWKSKRVMNRGIVKKEWIDSLVECYRRMGREGEKEAVLGLIHYLIELDSTYSIE